MAAKLTVTPNPTAPGSRPTVTATGFDPKTNVSLVFRGVGTTYKVPPKGNGGFEVGLAVPTTTPEGTFNVEARKAGTTTVLASTPLAIKKPVPPPDPTPPPTTRPIYGLGAQVTGGTGYPEMLVRSLAESGPDTLRYLMSGSNRIIRFAVEGDIFLPIDRNIDCRGSNITVDGSTAPGKGITVKGDGIQIAYGARNVIVQDIRHRGGSLNPDRAGSIAPVRDVQGVVLLRLSVSGAHNTGTIGTWDNVRDVTIQDCIIGPHMPSDTEHNFAVGLGFKTRRTTVTGCLIAHSNYRNPKAGWEGDVNDGTVADTLVMDAVGNLIWDYIQYGASVIDGAWANVVKNWYDGRTNGVMELYSNSKAFVSGNYSKQGHAFPASNVPRFAVPAWAVVPELPTALDHAKSVLANAGCRVGGLDAYDKAILAEISL